MPAHPVCAIFDIGKTNKKLFLFNEDYRIVYEESVYFDETVDEDGDACESLEKLQTFVFSSLQKVFQSRAYEIRAVNFSTYGASFVHINEQGEPVTPLYNYLKVYPQNLLQQFYSRYGGQQAFSVKTASPVLGHLNSGMQLYWLKYQKPNLYKKIKCSLHLPQYMSFLLTSQCFAELTSIGCHTNLWDFSKQQYHDWVQEEGVRKKLAPLVPSAHVVTTSVRNGHYAVGVGLHDSSAALIPYLRSFPEPFVLLSTGTWCISLNPFNHSLLTEDELKKDCLCYLTFEGQPVKASRLFAGNEHEKQTKRLAAHFGTTAEYYKSVQLNVNLLQQLAQQSSADPTKNKEIDPLQESVFSARDLSSFAHYEAAYHQLMKDLVDEQVLSTRLVLNNAAVKKLFVDGGFSKNPIYMHLLAEAFPQMDIYAATMAQASALGAAMAIHDVWNNKTIPEGIVQLKQYRATPSGFSTATAH